MLDVQLSHRLPGVNVVDDALRDAAAKISVGFLI
jgi:hypothetical protein